MQEMDSVPGLKIQEMAPHSSSLAWEIPWTEDAEGYSPWGCKRVKTRLSDYTATIPSKKLKSKLYLI